VKLHVIQFNLLAALSGASCFTSVQLVSIAKIITVHINRGKFSSALLFLANEVTCFINLQGIFDRIFPGSFTVVLFSGPTFALLLMVYLDHAHTQTHTHTHIYII
jgi:hypothetical protein